MPSNRVIINQSGLRGPKGDTGPQGPAGTGGGGGSGDVTSVNSQTPTSGNVSLTADNIPDGSTSKTMTSTERNRLGVATVWKGAYASGTTYIVGDLVSSAGAIYQSKVASNTGHTPASSPTQWDPMVPAVTPTTLGLDNVATSGSYADLADTPSIPTTSEDILGFNITNDMTGTSPPSVPNVGDWWVHPAEAPTPATLTLTKVVEGAITSTGTSLVLTFPSTLTSVPRMFVIVASTLTTDNVTIADSGSHTWTKDKVIATTDTGSLYVFSTGGGTFSSGGTITITGGTTSFLTAQCNIITGMTTVSVDHSSTGSSATGNAYTVTSFTPTANALCVSATTAVYSTGIVSSFVPGAGFTALVATSNASGRNIVGQYITGSGSATTAPCSAANSHPWVEAAVSYLGS